MLERRKVVSEVSESIQIVSSEQIKFDPKGIVSHIKKFIDLKAKGLIKNNSFEENLWINQTEFPVSITYLNFDLAHYKELNIILKCYILIKLSSGESPRHCQDVLIKLKRAIEITDGLDSEKLPLLEDFLLSSTDSQKKITCKHLPQYMQFGSLKNTESYSNLCDNYKCHCTKPRDLPNYQHILLFDHSLNDFIKNCTEDEKHKFYPVFLWWRITTIIPMRPIEFQLIEKNCISKDSGNKYWIRIPRKKQPAQNASEIEITNTLEINEETYNAIGDYTSVNNTNSKYLFSYEDYRNRFNIPPWYLSKTANTEILSINQMKRILRLFYSEILNSRYQISNIDMLTLGDTRHLAFCNMMLQGWNMLSIARMGGHKHIETQLHYHSHLKYFVQSWVYNLAQDYKFKRLHKVAYTPDFCQSEIISKSQIYKIYDFTEIHEVDYGYCTINPLNCSVGDCRFCGHYYFYPKDKYEDAMKWLSEGSNAIKHRIDEQLALMKHINLTMGYNFQTLDYQKNSQERLMTASNALKGLIEQQAMVDSLMEVSDEN